MTDRKLMKQALHTLEGWANVDDWVWPETAKEQAKRNTVDAIAALRERLAQPEQEPVSLNDGRLTQYADGRIGVGTPAEQELVIDCPRCGHCCPQRKE
jgi:uncharacterized ferredoxin-like protein